MAIAILKEAPSNMSLLANLTIPNDLNKELCSSLGKVVHITARLKNPSESVALRGDKGNLSWENDFANTTTLPLSNNEIHFVFPVPPSEMNATLMCKLVSKASDGKLKWQNSDNIICDLSKHGYIVALEVNNVSF